MNTMSTSLSGAPADSSDNSLSVWGRMARFSFRRHWLVLGAWVAIVVAIFALVGAIGSPSGETFSVPDSESKSGFDTLDVYFDGFGSGASGTIVFVADEGVDDPEVVAAMTEMFEAADEIEGVTITSPYSPEGQSRGLVATGLRASMGW